MKTILVIGRCYCGKNYFIEKFSKVFDCDVVHVGDIFRKRFTGKNKSATAIELKEVIKEGVKNCDKNKNIIINNAFRDAASAKEVLKLFDKNEIEIILIEDKRGSVDYSSRNREDDAFINDKIEYWNNHYEDLINYLKSEDYKIITIYNTDGGFIIK